MEKLISVIVPVYNVESYLRRCVDSLLTQTYQNLEILLVDDGSPDGSGAICDEYAAKDPRVRVIHKENGGLSSARNIAIDQAKGEYLTFVDSDDWLEPDACRCLADGLERYGADIACVGNWDVDSRTGEKTLGVCPEKEACITGEEMAGRIFTWDGCDSAACDKIYRRELFREYRYPVGMVCEDIPVTYRLALEAEKVVLLDKPVYNYFHHPGSITNAALSDKSFHYSQHTAGIYDYIRKNHPNILPQAEFLRVRSLASTLLMLELASREERRTYRSRYLQARRELRKHAAFVLKSPRLDKRERLRDILLMLGVYRALRPLFTRDRRE